MLKDYMNLHPFFQYRSISNGKTNNGNNCIILNLEDDSIIIAEQSDLHIWENIEIKYPQLSEFIGDKIKECNADIMDVETCRDFFQIQIEKHLSLKYAEYAQIFISKLETFYNELKKESISRRTWNDLSATLDEIRLEFDQFMKCEIFNNYNPNVIPFIKKNGQYIKDLIIINKQFNELVTKLEQNSNKIEEIDPQIYLIFSENLKLFKTESTYADFTNLHPGGFDEYFKHYIANIINKLVKLFISRKVDISTTFLELQTA